MYFHSRFKLFLALVLLVITLVLGSSLLSFHHVFAMSSLVSLKQLSSDPYINSSSQHKTDGTDLATNIDHIYAYTSTNGGLSWNNPVVVSTVTYHIQQASYRGGSLPSAEIDQAGKVYVVWADCRFETNCSAGDIVMSTSTDGLAWTTVQRIPIDPVGSGVDHFTAGIAVDKNTAGSQAHLALAYYYFANTNCTNVTCQLYAGFVSSVNGGASWSQNVQLAGPMSLKWLANTTDGYMTGDYISTSIVGGQAFPAITVAFAPLQKKLQEFMYTAALNVVGGPI